MGVRFMMYVRGICIARQQSCQEEKIVVLILWEMQSVCWSDSLQLKSSYPQVHQHLKPNALTQAHVRDRD